MRRIFKFPCPILDEFRLRLPEGAEIVHFGQQLRPPYELALWAVVDDEGEMEDRIFHIVGTGNVIPDGLTYIRTAQMSTGLVWHLYEEE